MSIEWKYLANSKLEDVNGFKDGSPLYSRRSRNSSSPSTLSSSFSHPILHSRVLDSEVKESSILDSINDRPSNRLDFMSTLPSSTSRNSSPRHTATNHYIESSAANPRIDSSRYSSLSSTVKKLQHEDYEAARPSSYDFTNKEVSTHPSILQPLTTHRASKFHSKHQRGSLDGHLENYKSNSITRFPDDENIKIPSMDFHEGDFKDSKMKGMEEKSFGSNECDSNGYEILRIQHFKLELKELKKELQNLKDENEILSKENQSLKESLRRFHSNSIITNAEAEVLTLDNETKNETITSYLRDIQTEEVSLSNLKHFNQTDKKLAIDMRRFSICSSSTENILNEADMLIKRTNREKMNVNIARTRGQKLSTSTMNSLSDIKTLYFNEPGSKLDMKLGDRVKFLCKEGKVEGGKIMYVGGLPEKEMLYVGLELDDEVGKHDGVFKGQRYFQCERNRGIFVTANKMITN